LPVPWFVARVARRRSRLRTALAVAVAGLIATLAPRWSVAQAAAPSGAVQPGPGLERATVGVGDRVRLRVWREPTISDEYLVDERGEVTFPRLGTLRVAGWSVPALHDSLVARFGEYLRDPNVTLTVLRRVGVQGEVRAPNLYYVDATKTLRELLVEAGGITDAGDAKRVTIVRDGRSRRVGGGGTSAFLAADLRSGDQVVVPRRSWWARNGVAALSTAGFALSALLSLVSAVRR
jgi:polysaccharide export outer membrane protein